MENIHNYIQSKWREGKLPGIDCLLFADGNVVMANAYGIEDPNTHTKEFRWSAICDTTIGSLEKYEPDIWTDIDIFHGAVSYGEGKIVFGDGCMGNEGFVASTDKNGDLNWGMFFTFSNPVYSAVIKDHTLICTTELGTEISIQLDDLTQVSIDITNMHKFRRN
ncbi:hypothetical protein [Pedobacter caeni]|nr:hypothetical protein [Pedobacter caeni]